MSEQITNFTPDLKAWKASPELTDIHTAMMEVSENAFNARFALYEQRIPDLSEYLEKLRQSILFACNVLDDKDNQAAQETVWPIT